MDMMKVMARAAAIGSIGLAAAIPAMANTGGALEGSSPGLSFSRMSYRADSGRALLLASSIVLLVGVIDDDRTLEVLGGIGVLYSIAQEQGGFYRFRTARHGIFQDGPASFGLATFGTQDLGKARPAPYVQLTFKF